MRRRYNRLVGKILIILTLFTLLFITSTAISDHNKKIDILINKHSKQQSKIEKLEYDNSRLYDVIAHQQKQIKDLQKSEYRIVEENHIKENSGEIHNEDKIDMTIDPTPTIVVGTLITVKGFIKKLMPSPQIWE
jgi:hypothetical protein